MNHRKWLILGVMLVSGVVCYLMWRSHASPIAGKQTETQQQPTSHDVYTAASVPIETNKCSGAAVSIRNPLAEAQWLERVDRWEASREVLIEFWGKVVDQSNRPIEGVTIKSSVTSHRIVIPVIPHPMPYFYATTDSNGKFHIKSDRGRGFTIESMEKQGYMLPPKLQGRADNLFYYNYDKASSEAFKADANNPYVFRLWKIKAPEYLIQGDKFYGIVPDGRIYGIDMLKAQKVEGSVSGDFTVRINRPMSVVLGQRGYDWSFAIDGIGGGAIESSDEFMYFAPDSGYQIHYEYVMSASDPKWKESINKQFYVKSRNGQVYARMEVEVIVNYQDIAVFSVRYFANPAGSRNLEYDPSHPVLIH